MHEDSCPNSLLTVNLSLLRSQLSVLRATTEPVVWATGEVAGEGQALGGLSDAPSFSNAVTQMFTLFRLLDSV